MNISKLNNISFGARMERTAGGFYDIRCAKTNCSQQDWIDSYDSQIKKIKEQKQRAIEFDNFMHSKEVLEIVNKLPDEDLIEISGDYLLKTKSGSDELAGENPYYNPQLDSFTIRYNDYDEDGNGEISEDEDFNYGEYVVIQNEDGSINKKGIIEWLKEIYSYKNE